jgi:hypothetical protein
MAQWPEMAADFERLAQQLLAGDQRGPWGAA